MPRPQLAPLLACLTTDMFNSAIRNPERLASSGLLSIQTMTNSAQPTATMQSTESVQPQIKSPPPSSHSSLQSVLAPAVKELPNPEVASPKHGPSPSPSRSRSPDSADNMPSDSKEKVDAPASDDENTRKKRNSRRKHRNSHLGCGTCKKRRIKCDEMLPQCFNCVKGKLHCAYLNLDAPARNALLMAQHNQNMRGDPPPEELMTSYFKDSHTDPAQATKVQQMPMQTIPMQAMPLPQGVSAAPSAVASNSAERFPSGYLPYQMVPQMVGGPPQPGAPAPNGMVQSMYRPVLLIHQPPSGPGNPGVVYSQVPFQMVLTPQMQQIVYQTPEQHQMQMAHKGQLGYMTAVGSMDGLPVMIIKSHSENMIPYESPTSMPNNNGSPHGAGAMLAPIMAQIPRLYPQGMTPVIMAPGTTQSPMMGQTTPGGPYHQMNAYSQIGLIPQIVHTPQLSLLHQAPQQQVTPIIQNRAVASPMGKPLLTPLSNLHYSTPLMGTANVPNRGVSQDSSRRNSNPVKVKSEYSSDYERLAEAKTYEKREYTADSPDLLNETEKVPSIKMLLS